MDVKVLNAIFQDIELEARVITSTIDLLNDGCTVPFIARYRKERTGGLDETQIRLIQSKLEYYTELEKRKETIIKTIKSQDKLTPELLKKIEECKDKQGLEDIYLPYKPKRRTRATIAKEKGLEALALMIIEQKTEEGKAEAYAEKFIDTEKGVNNVDEALAGARDIVAEMAAENADVRNAVRTYIRENAQISSEVKKDWIGKKSKFEQYYNFSEALIDSPSHRILAIRRGFKEGVLRWRLNIDSQEVVPIIEDEVIVNKKSVFHYELLRALDDAYERLLYPSLEVDLFSEKINEAGTEAISVFSKNLHNLLLAPPAGHKMIMGFDPGFRTGCKVAVVDCNGNFQEYSAVFPHPPQEDVMGAANTVLSMVKKYNVDLIAIGNGTASKESDTFIRALIKREKLQVKSLVVSEAGASVYSASEVAIREFPDLDVTVRGAISIARRLQDPLAELVKIDAKSIGVGQYQHDVNQVELKRSLDSTVESCVNHVGVELNTASAELLSYVSGIGPTLARNIIRYRTENGSFETKSQLKKVPKLGPKAFEQCAGFLRIANGKSPMDNSAIHPESFSVVKQMADDLGVKSEQLIANESLIDKINIAKYISEEAGEMTLNDIVDELRKPGFDPRDEFTSMEFRDDINELEDLQEDMILMGTVTNVTNFGAFVDVGVHQDGLVHISRLSDSFVKDPYDIVSVGDRVKVRVDEVDLQLRRIALDMKGLN